MNANELSKVCNKLGETRQLLNESCSHINWLDITTSKMFNYSENELSCELNRVYWSLIDALDSLTTIADILDRLS